VVDIDEPYWVCNEKVFSIWMPGEESPYLSRHLAEPVRRVLGFIAHPNLSIRGKADCCGLIPGEFIALNRMLYASDIATVRRCLQFGLPPSASVELCEPVRCFKCGSRIERLPCVGCWDGSDDDPYV